MKSTSNEAKMYIMSNLAQDWGIEKIKCARNLTVSNIIDIYAVSQTEIILLL